MANLSKRFEKEILDLVLGYFYENSPIERSEERDELKTLTPKYFGDVLNQMWEKISLYLHKKQDEVVFQLVSRSVNCSSLQSFLEEDHYELQINPKTLKNSLLREAGTERIHDFFRAFRIVVEAEEEESQSLKRVKGYFNVYNLHNTNKGKFQVSNLSISLSEHESYLTYFSRRYKKETKRVELEVIGNDKLLVTLREDNCFLAFYAFIGAMTQPKIIQAVFIYNNGLGQTIGSLAVFEKVESDRQLVEPKREMDDLTWIPIESVSDERRRVIQYFLLNQSRILKPRFFSENQSIKFNIEDLRTHPGPHGNEAHYYDDAKEYIGKYYIFFNERYPSVDIGDKRLNDFYSTVGRGVFEIYVDPKNGRFCCKMKTKKNKYNDVIEHDGHIVNDTLKSPSYLIISMYEKHYRHRYINIILMKTGGDILLGSHNIMYSRVGKLGVGSVVVVKAKDDFDFDDHSPKSLYPCPPNNKPLHDIIVNYLSRNSNALLSPVTDTSILFKEFADLTHSGVYRMYSHRRNGVRIGILEINKTGFVTHIGISGGKKTKAYGSVSQIRSVLNILLKNIENERTGFCSVKVSEVAPFRESGADRMGKERNTIYVGTFCGVTRRDGEFPLASKIVLEYMGEVSESITIEPKVVSSDSTEYQEIPSEIRFALKDREQAFIDYRGIRRGIYKLSDLQEFNDDNNRHQKTLINNLIQSLFLEKSNDNGELQSHKEKASRILYERAVYHAIVREDAVNALRFLRESKVLAIDPSQVEKLFKDEAKSSSVYDMVVRDL